MWRLEIESFPGPIVEPIGDELHIVISECGKVAAFGQMLAYQTVSIFVVSALPRAMGIGLSKQADFFLIRSRAFGISLSRFRNSPANSQNGAFTQCAFDW